MPQRPASVTVEISRDALSEILELLELGEEYAQEELIKHDAALGRDTRRNRAHAEVIEADIEKFTRLGTMVNETLGNGPQWPTASQA